MEKLGILRRRCVCAQQVVKTRDKWQKKSIRHGRGTGEGFFDLGERGCKYRTNARKAGLPNKKGRG